MRDAAPSHNMTTSHASGSRAFDPSNRWAAQLIAWRALASAGSRVGIGKCLNDRSVRVLLAVTDSLLLNAGDPAHIDGSGPEPRRLIADIEHRCRGAILWRQPQQVLAACPPDIYNMVRWRRLGRRWLGRRWCRGRSRGRGRCGWSGGLRRLCLHTRKQQSRQEYGGSFAVHPLLPS